MGIKDVIVEPPEQMRQAMLQSQMQGGAPQQQPEPPDSAGTPHNPDLMAQQMAQGEPVGNSMQGMENMQE